MGVRAQEQERGIVNWTSGGSPYSVLGVSPDCTEDDIKVAFRNRVCCFCVDAFVVISSGCLPHIVGTLRVVLLADFHEIGARGEGL